MFFTCNIYPVALVEQLLSYANSISSAPPTELQNWFKIDCYTLFLFNLKLLVHLLKQATIAERANAFRRQCELAETLKLKEINLYTPGYLFLLFAYFNFYYRIIPF